MDCYIVWLFFVGGRLLALPEEFLEIQIGHFWGKKTTSEVRGLFVVFVAVSLFCLTRGRFFALGSGALWCLSLDCLANVLVRAS